MVYVIIGESNYLRSVKRVRSRRRSEAAVRRGGFYAAVRRADTPALYTPLPPLPPPPSPPLSCVFSGAYGAWAWPPWAQAASASITKSVPSHLCQCPLWATRSAVPNPRRRKAQSGSGHCS